MKNAMKILNLGQSIMVLGSVLYVVELFMIEKPLLTAIITIIYLISLVLIAIGWVGTKDERKAEKERQKRKAA